MGSAIAQGVPGGVHLALEVALGGQTARVRAVRFSLLAFAQNRAASGLESRQFATEVNN